MRFTEPLLVCLYFLYGCIFICYLYYSYFPVNSALYYMYFVHIVGGTLLFHYFQLAADSVG